MENFNKKEFNMDDFKKFVAEFFNVPIEDIEVTALQSVAAGKLEKKDIDDVLNTIYPYIENEQDLSHCVSDLLLDIDMFVADEAKNKELKDYFLKKVLKHCQGTIAEKEVYLELAKIHKKKKEVLQPPSP